jgi:hypothetical protein
MASELTPQVLVFYRQGRNQFAFLTLLLAVLILFVIARTPKPPALYFALVVIYAGWAIDALYRRLTLTSDGLTYRKLLSTTTVRWEDARSIVTEGTLSRQEILIAQPAGISPARTVRIPLSYFSRSWRANAIGKLLMEKAPQLFAPLSPPAA